MQKSFHTTTFESLPSGSITAWCSSCSSPPDQHCLACKASIPGGKGPGQTQTLRTLTTPITNCLSGCPRKPRCSILTKRERLRRHVPHIQPLFYPLHLFADQHLHNANCCTRCSYFSTESCAFSSETVHLVRKVVRAGVRVILLPCFSCQSESFLFHSRLFPSEHWEIITTVCPLGSNLLMMGGCQ